MVLGQDRERFVGKDNLPVHLGPEPVQIVFDEQGDVLASLAQRRQGDGDDLDAVEEVLAHLPRGDPFGQIAVGGGDDAEVGLVQVGAADRGEALPDGQPAAPAPAGDAAAEESASGRPNPFAVLARLRRDPSTDDDGSTD